MVRLLLFFFFKLAAAYLCFNSSMVRLLLKISRSGEIQFNVSIPQWYDYYFTNHFAIIPSALVSIPQWYDYYLLNNNNIPILNGVSIPQWYDYYFCLNYLQPFAISFNSSMVRLLLHILNFSFLIELVSIPQWYDYYRLSKIKEALPAEFQFLNGTIITACANCRYFILHRFQFLNGTIITCLPNGMAHIRSWFQFLNGTIITK